MRTMGKVFTINQFKYLTKLFELKTIRKVEGIKENVKSIDRVHSDPMGQWPKPFNVDQVLESVIAQKKGPEKANTGRTKCRKCIG